MRLRIFMSVRTMGLVSAESRACGSCRGQYYSWKEKNSDLEELLSRLEDRMIDLRESECEVSSYRFHLDSSDIVFRRFTFCCY